MRWVVWCVFSAVVATGCVAFEEDLDRGYVACGDGNVEVVCQPGTYCSSPLLAVCHVGCASDANCLDHEKCLKDKDADLVGDCVPTKLGPCCGL